MITQSSLVVYGDATSLHKLKKTLFQTPGNDWNPTYPFYYLWKTGVEVFTGDYRCLFYRSVVGIEEKNKLTYLFVTTEPYSYDIIKKLSEKFNTLTFEVEYSTFLGEAGKLQFNRSFIVKESYNDNRDVITEDMLACLGVDTEILG